MNNDLISRKALKAEILGRIALPDWALEAFLHIIDNAPTVDAYTEDDVNNAIKEGHEVGYEMAKAIFKRPTGEWIMNKTSIRGRNYTCTHCKRVSRNKFDFCPNCGADMRVKED